MHYEDLPTGNFFPGHCDIVVATRANAVDVVGGNVDNSVAMKQVPAGPDGRLADATGRVLDPEQNWFVVLRVLYNQ